ncbi:NADH:flavin oxidoreductase/NADH oxidase [Coprinopsis marcescibilis]|uniref:NADH:flavin oxidoreductase/NADH oxidase n=1 Tax=Coprinopsis marcescibilis TaxID=230819 RepID=A0A5C3L7H4_COPMA|nr:NADH:flavin oxidoreductase/NADH oxidase [Coprinopsis marcescibilis]
MEAVGPTSIGSDLPALFQPIAIGKINLKHRIVLAPLTRVRATTKTHLPVLPLVKTYYEQRASVPGTLLISEATVIAEEACGWDGVPGIWNDGQVKVWKEITEAVHSKGCSMFLQLWAIGRAARPKILSENEHPYIAPSAVKLSKRPVDEPPPREMAVEEIKRYCRLFAEAAKRAVNEAGFDGVEVHGSSPYLIGQFLQEGSNIREDEYGGNIEGRSKFPLEVVDALVEAVGQDRVGVRLTPWTNYDFGTDKPIPQYLHFVSEMAKAHSKLAYLHMVEPRHNPSDWKTPRVPKEGESNDVFRKAWAPRPFISCGCYTRETAIETAERKGDLIAFGQAFIANPDLPFRLEKNISLEKPDHSTFYTPDAKGYTDYPLSKEFEKNQA